MTDLDLQAIVRDARGNGGKVRRAVEKTLGLPRPRFGDTAEWYARWNTGLAEQLAHAYDDVFKLVVVRLRGKPWHTVRVEVDGQVATDCGRGWALVDVDEVARLNVNAADDVCRHCLERRAP